MAVKQKVVILKKKNGNASGVAIKKSSGMVVIQKDRNGIISISKNPGHFYINGSRYIPPDYK